MSTKLLYFLRGYIRRSPVNRGKTFVVRRMIIPLLRRLDSPLMHEVVPGCVIELSRHEDVGLGVWLYGSFEKSELDYMSQLVRPNDVVCDIGANIGLFTLAMSAAVGSKGRVLSFEPLESNVERLRNNIARNHLKNIDVFPVALANYEGRAQLAKTPDAAYGHIQESTLSVTDSDPSVEVPVNTLDRVWIDEGRPQIKLIKIDVEGAESMVIDGGSQCLGSCLPYLIIEANSESELKMIRGKLRSFGYEGFQPIGFRRWNWLFQTKKKVDSVA